jgi:hypothetical protein
MAKGRRNKGPPYEDNPGCKYVVIIDPCGMDSAKDRNQGDVNRLGSWIALMLREQTGQYKDVSVEAVYMRQTVCTLLLCKCGRSISIVMDLGSCILGLAK